MRAAVVGGGLAGLAAALELVDAGLEVTLLEARPTLGGAVQTLPEREGDPDPPPDNGQHIALGCCTEYLRFLGRVGRAGAVRRERLDLPVIGEDGSVARIATGPVALLRYRHVPLRDRLAIARVTRRLARLVPEEHDDETFAGLLRRLGQSQAAIDRFWDVFVRPALNLRSDEVSAAPALFTVQTALLGAREASDLVLPVEPLGAMHGEAAAAALAGSGGEARTGARAVAVEEGVVLLADGKRVEADVVVVALPPAESARLLGEPDPALEDSPIVSAHLLFDRPILRFELAALLGSPAHWAFDRGRLTGREPARGQYVTVVSSGAPELLPVRGKTLVDLLAGELTGRLGRADLLWSRVSREPAATFAALPGTASRRPGPETGRPGVARAGAWTDTGWPATMESAVRSGRAAARHALATGPARTPA
ncbi:MAG TPA: hydroxysqualene dehydroxylase HpnE [Gaiellaceae bacterium]|nr:hydroxysqualene dehydroxylase HpnE [Gaiellaceae bacterium]